MTNSTVAYLASLDLPALQKLAMQNNLTVHHKTGEKKLRQMIADKIYADMNQQKPKEAIKPEPKVDHFNSRDEVLKIVHKIQSIKPDFTATFSDEDPTVKFTYRGAMDTCNLSVPLRKIQMVANTVSQGAWVLANQNEHFDSMPTNGKSGYTATVL